MIAVYKNKDGFVNAYVDYQIVDDRGFPDKEGLYCWINNVWVHKTVRQGDTLKRFIEEEHSKFLSVKWIYWKRSKYNDRMSIYDITKLYKKEK